ncbi:uncharacterized protein DFL_003929 [Arthrobotrys flagrans]|uniref:Cryptic loci regulator 2 N-terminal domain-containing protein n=1 Tax=Arthrobotrys flagrans TaxID=97331 RepID=A0A437A376_ARTFL|nr:hypothetical protein DFL_003929 [Arthrobotrys flagrans]
MHTPFKRIGLLLLILITITQSFVSTSPLFSDTRDHKPSSTNIKTTTLSTGKPEPQPTNTDATTTPSKRQAPPEALKALMRSFNGGDTPARSAQPEPNNPETQNNGTQHHNGTLTKKIDIPSSFFYSDKGLFIRCNSPRYVYDLVPFESPDFPTLKLKHWTNWKERGDFWSVEEVIKERQWACYSCTCTPNGGLVKNQKRNCASERTVVRCVVLLCCYCTAELLQPEPIEGATVADYQNALQRMPATVRGDNKDYRWLFGGRGIGFDPDTTGPPPLPPGPPPLPPVRWAGPPLVPGPEFEPAPEEVLGEDWEDSVPIISIFRSLLVGLEPNPDPDLDPGLDSNSDSVQAAQAAQAALELDLDWDSKSELKFDIISTPSSFNLVKSFKSGCVNYLSIAMLKMRNPYVFI